MASEIDPDSLSGFLDESGAALETLSARLLSAEQGALPAEALNEMFRAAHSIKGLAGFLGLSQVQKLTHSLETLLDRVRQGKRPLDAPAIDACLQAVDVLSALLADLRHGRGETQDIAPALQRLGSLAHEGQGAAQAPEAEAALGALPDWLRGRLDEDEALEILIATKQGEVHALHVGWDAILADPRDPVEIFHVLEARARILTTVPLFNGATSAFSSLEHFHSAVGIILGCDGDIAALLADADFPACSAWRLGSGETPPPLEHRPERDRIRLGSQALSLKPGMEKHVDMFLAESRDELDILDSELIAYEAAPLDRDRLGAVFRLMHRLKSSCAAMGLSPLAAAAHHCESLLAQYRQSGEAPGEKIFKALFSTKDFLGLCLDKVASGETAYSEAGDLEQALTEALGQPADPVAPAALPMSWQPLAANAQAKGLTVYDAYVALAPATPLADLRYAMVLRAAGALGEVLVADPALEALEAGLEDPGQLHLLLGTSAREESVRNALHLDMVMRVDLKSLSPLTTTPPPSAKRGEGESPMTGDLPEAPKTQAAAASVSNTVRVDAGRLDSLLNIAGELTVAKARVTQLTERIGRCLAESHHPLKEADDAVAQLREALLTLNRHIGALQSGVMQARMVPVGPLFQRFHRLVRDICKDNGKQARLLTVGEATELDKKLIDELADPLTHLIRNSVDHGLESVSEREAARKPAQGTVRLEAFHDGGQVCIRIGDDGRGLDVTRIKAKAVRMGLISEAQAAKLSNAESHQLIFLPGFSTAAQVTNISGRGVGMDIVRSKVLELKGQIDIASLPGQGCAFTIRLPLTLAMIDGLLVQVGKTRFLFPVESVQEIVDVPPESCKRVAGGGTLFALREQVVALLEVRELLQADSRSASHAGPIRALVLKTSGEPIAVAVDRVYGREETVIKPLSPEFARVRGLAGATVLGDGSIALIVDAAALRELALKRLPPPLPTPALEKAHA